MTVTGPAGGVPRRTDRGSAAVWVLALSGVLLLAGTASVLAGLAIISRHEAGTAADLAALAAASRALSGSEVACAQAARVVEANGATLESCDLAADGVVDVTATVSVEFGSLGLGVARAQARAGPADGGLLSVSPSWSARFGQLVPRSALGRLAPRSAPVVAA